MDYVMAEGKTERLVGICQQAGADTYISGPAGRAYLDPVAFTAKGIALSYFDYAGYPEYAQLYPPFDHQVSILDLLFNVGPDATPVHAAPADPCAFPSSQRCTARHRSPDRVPRSGSREPRQR